MKLEFEKKKITSVDGRPRFLFIQKCTDNLLPFTIECSPNGITFRGTMIGEIENGAELELLAEAIGNAWSEHRKLVPKILSATGH